MSEEPRKKTVEDLVAEYLRSEAARVDVDPLLRAVQKRRSQRRRRRRWVLAVAAAVAVLVTAGLLFSSRRRQEPRADAALRGLRSALREEAENLWGAVDTSASAAVAAGRQPLLRIAQARPAMAVVPKRIPEWIRPSPSSPEEMPDPAEEHTP